MGPDTGISLTYTAGYRYYGKHIGRLMDVQTYEYRRGGISDLFFY
jgi:hypothetical protein